LHWKVGYRKQMYSENQMKHCMKLLRSRGMIELVSHPRGNLITVLNYAKYQNPKTYESTSESTSESTNDQPMINRPSPSIREECNNEKNERMKEESTPADKMRSFIKSINEKNNSYMMLISNIRSKTNMDEFKISAELDKFARYWTEKNKSGVKERWEMEKTFEVQKRLITWFSNIDHVLL